MILESRRRAVARGLPAEFEVGDAQAVRFADATFDACRTERVLMHVPDAERAFAEMVREILVEEADYLCLISTGRLRSLR